MASKNLSDAETGAWAGLVRAGQLVLDAVDAELKRQGLPPLAWYDVLLELKRARGGRLRLNEIGERVLLSKSNVTRLVDRLEARGLVRREPCPDDARGAFARITGEGRKLSRRMWPVYRDVVRARFLAHLDGAETRRLAAVLRRIVAANR